MPAIPQNMTLREVAELADRQANRAHMRIMSCGVLHDDRYWQVVLDTIRTELLALADRYEPQS